jgi:hypothetical protein
VNFIKLKNNKNLREARFNSKALEITLQGKTKKMKMMIKAMDMMNNMLTERVLDKWQQQKTICK